VGESFSTPVQTGSETHPASYTVGNESFPRVKPGVETHTHLAPRFKKEQRYTSTPLWAFVARSRVKSIF